MQGAIDYVGTDWKAADGGKRSLDLNGTPGVGGVLQEFSTRPNQQYHVSFKMAGHPSGLHQEMKVSAEGQSQVFSFESGKDPNNLGWIQKDWYFTAHGYGATLAFESQQTGYLYGGPALDDVKVEDWPTPTTTTSNPPAVTPGTTPPTGLNSPPGTNTGPTFVTLGGQHQVAAATPLSTAAQINPLSTQSSSSSMSFLSAANSSQTISAQASGETLIGSSQFGDMFQGTSANLNGDLIKLFGGNDVIDVTDLNFASATHSYSGTATAGTLSLSDGVHSTGITLAGDFNQANFHLASDMHGGTNVTYT